MGHVRERLTWKNAEMETPRCEQEWLVLAYEDFPAATLIKCGRSYPGYLTNEMELKMDIHF